MTKRFLQIVDQRIKEVEHANQRKEDYDSAGWAFRQADLNGQLRSLNIIRNLFNQ